MAAKAGNGKKGSADPFKAPKDYDKAAVKAGQRVGQNDDHDGGDDDQTVPAGERAEAVAKGDEPPHGKNSKEFTDEEISEQIAEFLELMDEVEETIAENNRECAAKNQPHRKRLGKAATVLVKDGVVSTEVLAKIKRKHRLERNAENVDSTLGDDQKREFDRIVKGLKGLVGTPLGDAAVAAAERQHAH